MATVAAFLLGLAVYPLLIAPLQKRLGRRAPGPLFLVLTLGLSALLQNSLLAAAGGEYLKVPPAVKGGLDLSFTFVSGQRLLILVVASVGLGGALPLPALPPPGHGDPCGGAEPGGGAVGRHSAWPHLHADHRSGLRVWRAWPAA